MSLWSKFSKPMCHWKVMVETRVTEEVDVDEKDGMVVAKVEEEEATMTIQLMKRQVIIHPGANGRPNEKRYDKSHIEFFNAHKFGHYALKCCYDTNGVEERANFVDKEEGEEKTLLLALKDDEKDDKNPWYLDDGASNHTCDYKEKFVELDEKVNNNVLFGDTSKVQIQEKIAFYFLFKMVATSLVTNVYYVPKLKK